VRDRGRWDDVVGGERGLVTQLAVEREYRLEKKPRARE